MKIMDFLKTTVLQPETRKVVDAKQLKYVIYLGQGNLLTLACLSSIHTFQRSSSLKPLG